MPSEKETEHCRSSLDRVGWKVDYVVTHEAPAALAEGCVANADVSTAGIRCKPSWVSSTDGSATASGSSVTTIAINGATPGIALSTETSCRSKMLRPVLETF